MSISGVILAGGTGSRLWPLTELVNKHLLPVYNKPMIIYALQALINANIKDILIVSGREHAGQFLQMLGSGKDFGVNLSYTVQEKSGGIAEALSLAKRFANRDSIAVILGDNIYEDKFTFNDFREGAKVFLKRVPMEQAQRFGVARLDKDNENRIVEIVEKPINPPSNIVVTGLYLYDNTVFDKISCIKPSARGELEITDINNMYVKDGRMDYQIIEGFWSDMGTVESLYRASSFVRSKTINRKNKGDV